MYTLIFFLLYFAVQVFWFQRGIKMSSFETLAFLAFYLIVLLIVKLVGASGLTATVIFLISIIFFFPKFRKRILYLLT
jgi:hypothetical protein